MCPFSSNAVASKAKSMYAKHLVKADYDEILKRKSLAEMVNYLKSETDYANVLEGIKDNTIHRGQLESLLNKEYYERCAKLIRYASKNEMAFYRMGVMLGEIELLLNKIRILSSEFYTGFDLNIPDYLAKRSSYPLYGLINANTYDEIISLVKGSPYEKVIISFKPKKEDERIDYNMLEIELKRIYYDAYVTVIKKLYKGNKQKDLLNVVYSIIELQNITKIYRLKKYFNATPTHIKTTLLLQYSRISKTMMEELIQTENADAFLKKLSESSYKFYMDDHEFVFIEYYTDRIKYNLAKRYMRFSSDASLVYMTYCILHSMEIDNLKHIIEGIRYEESAASIEKMLIY